RLFRVVDVLGGHRLVVGQVGPDEDQQIGSDPVGVGNGGRSVADRLFQADGAGGVTQAGRIVDVVGTQEAGHFIGGEVNFVGQTPGSEEEGQPFRIDLTDPLCGQIQRLIP